MRLKTTLTTFAALFVAFAAHSATMVYNNGVSYSGFYLNPGANEVGDEIILGAGPRIASSFQFEYYGSGFSGNEQYQIRFYLNDGTDLGGPFNTHLPSTVFYNSGLLPLAAPVDIVSSRATYLIDLSYTNIVLPDRFTWSIQITGITGSEAAGPTIYNPPLVGNNFDDYWYNTGASWQLRASNGVPISFGAQLSAVPEPSTYVLAILGGICGFALVIRKRSRS